MATPQIENRIDGADRISAVKKWFLRIAVFTSLFWMGLASYWLWLDDPVLFRQSDGWIESEDGKIYPGSVIYTQRRFCLYREIVKGSVSRAIVDDFVFTIADTDFEASGPGCFNSRHRVMLPQSMHVGHYRYMLNVTFTVNPLKDKTVAFPTIEFDVVPRT